jgi:integrase/recombinase XerC
VVKGKYEIKQTFLTKEQVEIIRQKLAGLNNTQITLFFELGLYSMARVNALANITLKQLNFETKRIERVIEKEGYEVELMMDDRIIELIKKWLLERTEKGIECDFLFVTRYDKSWNNAKSAMQDNWIKKIGEFINEDEMHCHDLRHSGSNLKYQAGMSLENVSKGLNHKGTQVTQDSYLKMDYNKLQSEMEKFSI